MTAQPPALQIRTALIDDLDTIVEFNQRLAMESEARALDAQRLVPGVRRVLTDASLGVYYVASLDQRIVGQLMLTREWSDWRCGDFWWIQSVYVVKEHRRGGIFSALYAHVLELARSREDVCGLRLYVESDNTRAQATYERQGMQMTGYRVMEIDFRGGH
ncbi:MAG: GNAT family N-acetyltransferase [Gammaproteobacteria bacterium]|nr:GNAT family N-acetyltransferase [Gammaproteobacteria bacterium]